MMSRTLVENESEGVAITVGFAAGTNGDGVAYAALRGPDGRRASFVRVAFRCRALSALLGRDVAYAALRAVAVDLARRGARVAEIRIANADLVADLDERRALPPSLVVPYVTLRCALNRLAGARVRPADERTAHDLTARARAEISLNVAA